MEKDIGLCDLLCDYYESKILFGYCKYGDRLPSIAQISSISQLGQNTVRGAFKRLREKGYIQSEERKASVVSYRGTSADFEKNKADYFVPREDGIRDFFQAARLLFIPVWETALENTGAVSYTHLNSVRKSLVILWDTDCEVAQVFLRTAIIRPPMGYVPPGTCPTDAAI